MNITSTRSSKPSGLIPIAVLMVQLAFAQTLQNTLTLSQQATVQRLHSFVIQRCCVQKPAAVRIKTEIARMVKEGRSDQEILARYRALIGVPQAAETARLMLLPVGGALVAIASVGAKVIFRSWRRNRAARRLSAL
jgi:cytochrome c-type biogenesis protein CcmH/NrfF